MGEHEHELTPEDVIDAIRRMKVSDVLVSTIATVGQLGYAKLEPQSRDLEQVRLAIEALRALTPVLEGHVAVETVRDFNQLVANLQLAYVSAVSAPTAAPSGGDEQQPPEAEPPAESQGEPADSEPEPEPAADAEPAAEPESSDDDELPDDEPPPEPESPDRPDAAP